MDEFLKIYVDQLKAGKTEKISHVLSPEFLEVAEKDLCFKCPVRVEGEAYIASEDLVLHLDIETAAFVPCSVCNEPVEVPLTLKGVYYAEPLKNIRGAIYDMTTLIRDTVLLEAPRFAECGKGECPERKNMGKYLKKKDLQLNRDESEEGHCPFSDLL